MRNSEQVLNLVMKIIIFLERILCFLANRENSPTSSSMILRFGGNIKYCPAKKVVK